MQAFLEHFITQSATYTLIAIALVAFLESLALVGLILPGTVMMAGLGALIGSGEVNFWYAWLAGIVGCLLGDWISFWLGWRFKKPLHRWSFMKKNKALLDKTEHALHQHSMFTILVGRFVGPTRPGRSNGCCWARRCCSGWRRGSAGGCGAAASPAAIACQNTCHADGCCGWLRCCSAWRLSPAWRWPAIR